MKLLAIFLVVYVSPGCLSQCVNCAPQPTYQSPCCVPTSNVQTIQSARAFTNGAQGSQVIMYYNGQRVVSDVQPQQQQQPQGSNFNQATNNYQNPGPIPSYQTGYDQDNQNQNQTGYYPNNLNGGVVAGGATTGTVVIGGVTQTHTGPGINAGGNVGNPNPNINAGGNVGGQNQNQNQFQNNDPNINAGGNVGGQNQNQNQNQFQNPNDPYQNQPNFNTGGVVGGQNQNSAQYQGPDGQYQYQNQDQNAGGNFNNQQYQNQNMNAGGYLDNQNQGQFQDQNQGQFQGSTLAPAGGEVGYQPFTPSGNTDYNNGAQSGAYDQQNQQGPQGQYQQNQNDQQVIYPSGGVVPGGAVAGSSYNSPNSGYVNSQVQPQTYPTQVVTGGAVPNQNVQQQPDVNTQYQDQMNQQNQQNMGGQQGAQGNNFGQGGQQGGVFVGSTTPQQGQQFTSAPNNQFQQVTQGQQGQQEFTNQPQQGDFNNQNQGGFTSTPGYQQGGQQQQFTTFPQFQNGQFQDGQQGYTDNTLTPPIDSAQNDNSQQFTQTPSTPSPIPVIYPIPGAGQTQPPQQQVQQSQDQNQQFQQTQAPQQQEFQQPQDQNQQFQQTQPPFQATTVFPGTTPYPVIYPVPSAGQETTQTPFPQQPSTISSNQDEFGVSWQSQNDSAFETTTQIQTPSFVPVPVPMNSGNVPMESSATPVPIQNDFGTDPVTGTTNGQFIGGVQGNQFQSTTPTTNFNNNGQSSTGFQPITGMPVTNDNMNQAGFSSTMDPNMPQAQYPSQQEILAATGQQADQSSGANMASTPAPQFPSQQELGATVQQNQNTQPTPAPQFPVQQNLGATTQNNNFQDGSTQQAGANAQFPSQQELLQRDQQNSGANNQNVNDSAFTPVYGDMNTPYGRYASTTAVKASSNPQFDQPTADQQQSLNSAGTSFKVMFATFFMVFLW
ncbi:hypothetical protein L5515_019102 [Caenorhabditis briggsae]|uniref:Prion-like-(Q/N-rich)-domain-bearing protein n=1 Tax=Caenorhabditis briggsae TaxID=6238 RepID=A0AAE9JTP4_CAEBR|nr:hypothetical protein L5515_019102 [Caenorhabditis briggsae]